MGGEQHLWILSLFFFFGSVEEGDVAERDRDGDGEATSDAAFVNCGMRRRPAGRHEAHVSSLALDVSHRIASHRAARAAGCGSQMAYILAASFVRNAINRYYIARL